MELFIKILGVWAVAAIICAAIWYFITGLI